MAIVLRIDNGDLRGRVDYTRYLASPERSPVVLRDRMNQPALLDFTLLPADDGFVQPRRSAFVHLEGLAEALPPGGPRAPGPLFTGFITNEPVIEFLGVAGGRPVHGYRCQATSEEYLLNVKRIGLLPPMLNQTAGQILRFLAEHLQPGRFDLAQAADGAFVPFFVAGPEGSWSAIARELAERSGFYYRVLDGKIVFQPVGDLPAGVVVDERERRFRPEALEVTPLGNPVHNDVTVFGGAEPQAYVVDHFAGDGFTARFPLTAAVFGAESARLLADDFTGAAIDTLRWQESDPGGFLSMFEGRLNITGGNGTLGDTTLLARQAVELGGELELVHGEYEFTGASAGILGGLYAEAALTKADCLLGFDAAPISGQTRLRALVQGAVQPLEVITQPGHHYVLVTRLGADQAYRIEQSFAGAAQTFGGAAIAAQVRVTFEVRDFDLADAATPAVTVLHEATLGDLPAVAFYAPINSADLHVVVNFLQISRPIQARLVTETPGQAPRVGTLGFGIAGQDATITADPNRNQWALEFYEDTIPERGERITLTYRAAGRARARVRDGASVAAEAQLAGDDGVRAIVLRDVNPAPRTSAEAELAAHAYLADHVAPRYEGRYATWGEFADLFPRSGRLLEVRNESRYAPFTALVREVRSEIRELATERILHTVEFGQPSRFEELLKRFLPAENVLQQEEELPLVPVEVAELGSQFLADTPNFTLSDFVAGHFLVDMGAPPPAGGSYEVRRSDQGWSTATQAGTPQNRLAAFSTQTFVLPRTARQHAFYIRPAGGDGRTSRHSCVLGIRYPLVPAAPAALRITFGEDAQQMPVITATVEISETNAGDVDRVELRDADDATVLAEWSFGQLQLEAGVYRAGLVIDNSVALVRSKALFAYTRNALGEYSAAAGAAGTKLEPAKPFLSPGNSVGQIIEVLLDSMSAPILETQIQAAGPGGDFATPDQDILLPGQPQKFSLVASRSGAWGFRARRRDALGWSPWSSEPQGQISGQILVFFVTFFRALELDPSIGAAINSQNLLPNSDFFLQGIAGQEGVHAPRYYRLINASSDGSEVDYSAATNESLWKAGVNFAAANPGFGTQLTNLGKLLNPGEPVTLSAALRHSGELRFAHGLRFALRSASVPAYEQAGDLPPQTVTSNYRWYSMTFLLPADQAVPADLAAELQVVVGVGQAIATGLFCDKVILNRGHRPAAFNLAPWDILALAWNSGAAAYDLPQTLVAGTPRASDPGNAGLLVGTGTEDLDPDFTGRYTRLIT